VKRIFAEYVAGRGMTSIARGLTQDGIACPSVYDKQRNPHRNTEVWETTAIRAILQNPRYTGRQVCNRLRTDEVLIDVDDIALGHENRHRWNDPSEWVWSKDEAHTPAHPHRPLRASPADRQGARITRRHRQGATAQPALVPLPRPPPMRAVRAPHVGQRQPRPHLLPLQGIP
jgi:hypothetical protein